MSDQAPNSSRFTPQNQTTQERLATNTVGLVKLSDFRKRRAELVEQQEREAREKNRAATGASTPIDRSQTGTPANASEASDGELLQSHKRKKQKRAKIGGLSFAADDEEGDDAGPSLVKKAPRKKGTKPEGGDNDAENSAEASDPIKPKPPAGSKFAPNTSVAVVPRALTKAALRREAAERDALRQEFIALQAAVKATEVAIPFVFYDGTNIPGGTVTVKKGDFVWVFLDKSRKVGAKLNVGGDRIVNARRDWARVGVDDLMLVRGTIIIPHHYEFYFFIMNKTLGPGNRPLFDFSGDLPTKKTTEDGGSGATDNAPPEGLRKSGDLTPSVDISTLEGADEDPNQTKVVDRRWYEKNKHIYPASVWQEFEPDKDYTNEVQRDTGGNTFFYSR